MKAKVMLSSVVGDKIPLGRIASLGSLWFESANLPERLKSEKLSVDSTSTIPFSFLRKEIRRHLMGKYGLEVYIFEEDPGPGHAPEEETVRQAMESHLVLGIFGTKTGWKVGDQDPLTPTLREWRAALQYPLKFKVFWLEGSKKPGDLAGELGEVMSLIADYKKGKIYWEFSDTVELFTKVDEVVQDHLNRATVRYAIDTIAREPTDETEEWLLSSYRARHAKMRDAFDKTAATLGIAKAILQLGKHKQPVELHCVPDNFSIAESRKFAAYVFEDEAEGRKAKELGHLHFVAVFGGITDLGIRRHVGNMEGAEVYSGSWGYYAKEPSSGIQCVYLPKCTNSLQMQATMSAAITWLMEQADDVNKLAQLRSQILDLL